MNLKQIVKTGLVAGGLLAAVNGFADGNLPTVYADELVYLHVGYEFGGNYISLGYDTFGDGLDDVNFHYTLDQESPFEADTYLAHYAVDLDFDGEYSDDEWFEYIPGEQDFNGEKEDLLEVNPEDLLFYQIGYDSDMDYIALGYDTDYDGWDDARFDYELDSIDLFSADTYLDSYMVDLNGDGEYSEDEWFYY